MSLILLLITNPLLMYLNKKVGENSRDSGKTMIHIESRLLSWSFSEILLKQHGSLKGSIEWFIILYTWFTFHSQSKNTCCIVLAQDLCVFHQFFPPDSHGHFRPCMLAWRHLGCLWWLYLVSHIHPWWLITVLIPQPRLQAGVLILFA